MLRKKGKYAKWKITLAAVSFTLKRVAPFSNKEYTGKFFEIIFPVLIKSLGTGFLDSLPYFYT